MKYIVIKKFRDLQDDGRIYNVGDEYKGKRQKHGLTNWQRIRTGLEPH